MARLICRVVGACTAALLAASLSAQEPGVASGRAPEPAGAMRGAVDPSDVPRTADAVVVDGVLDDAAWRSALVLTPDIETNPRENEPAQVETFVYLVEDGSNLFIAFDARDPDPGAIRAYLRDRDSAYDDDFVGVVLDTFNDQRRAFEFFVNPLGVQMDMVYDDVAGTEDDSWDAIWQSAGRIGEGGFVVEMAIPFSQLRFRRTNDTQIWGIDALRFHPREDRARLSTSPQDRGRNCYLCQIGKIRGFASAEPGRGLEIVPSLTASRTDRRDAAGEPLVQGDTESDAGVNVRWSITPDLVANLALNPDFSQIEADVAQLDVNNQFALFFPETRPFFLDGANFFTTPINAVFTRTVADPDVGAKLTGTAGSNTFGFFAAEDTVTNLLFPGALRSTTDTLDESNRTIVGRYRRDIGSNSTVGALFTSRSAAGYDNRVAGIDGRYRPNDKHSLQYQFLRSDTRYPSALAASAQQPEGDFSGDALRVNYDFSLRQWYAFANYRSFDPTFRADAGFVSQVDMDNRIVGFNRTWHGDGLRWWNRIRVGIDLGETHDSHGQLLDRTRTLFASVNGPRQSYVEVGFSGGERFWDGRIHDTPNVFFFGQIRPIGGLSFSIFGRAGDQIDFENSRSAEELRLEPSMDWNVNRHMLLRLQHTAVTLDNAFGEKIFDADLTDLRLTWQFSVRSFLRLTLQQQLVERNLAQFIRADTDERSKTRGAQLLYSYQLNPQTVLFAGYSDNHVLDATFARLTKTDRTFFLKFSYAWLP